MPSDRVNHGCGVIERGNSKYLVVFGGRNTMSSNLQSTDIIVLNMDLKSAGWKADTRYEFLQKLSV